MQHTAQAGSCAAALLATPSASGCQILLPHGVGGLPLHCRPQVIKQQCVGLAQKEPDVWHRRLLPHVRHLQPAITTHIATSDTQAYN
jgi:hypothetical protein